MTVYRIKNADGNTNNDFFKLQRLNQLMQILVTVWGYFY